MSMSSTRTPRFTEADLSLQDVSFDEEENIHDQLGQPDLVHVTPTKSSRRVYLFLFLGMIFVTAILGVAISKRKEQQNSARMAQQLNDVIVYLSKHSDPTALATIGSPQRRAAEWMVYDDALQRKIPTDGDADEWKFLQRYALVVLYHSTQDEAPWTYPQLHFAASKRHECNWNHPFQSFLGDSTLTFNMGAICNDLKQVEKIVIGTHRSSATLIHDISFTHMIINIGTDGNGLNGALPEEVGLLRHLTKLSLDGNALVGQLPSSLVALTKLRSLTLTYNEFSGSLPAWIGQLTMLNVLGLANNRFHGTITTELSALTTLTTLALDDNHFIGDLSALSNLNKLEELYLDSNVITGSLDALVQLEKLQVLDVSSNRLHGSIPRGLLHLSNLRILDLHDNKLDKALPSDMPHSTSLSFLTLHDNSLSGSIPSTINHLSLLKHLDLSSNRFTGDIPSTLGNLTDLEYLVLANNPHLNGGPLPNLGALSNLVELSFQNTNRTGALPHWLGDLSKLVVLDLGENHFDGPIPIHLSKLKGLELLFLHRNRLTGSVPNQLSHLSNLGTYCELKCCSLIPQSLILVTSVFCIWQNCLQWTRIQLVARYSQFVTWKFKFL
jgi:Leucine-rich repeat (LRR) protein